MKKIIFNALLILNLLVAGTSPANAKADESLALTNTHDDCAAKLLPQALNLEKVRPDSFTAHANEFMKALWPAMSRGENVLEVQSTYFTTFVAQHLPEMIQNHDRNRIYAHQEVLGDSQEKIVPLLEKHLSYVDAYISQLQKRIILGEQLNYLDVLRFSYFLVLTREPEAHRKLQALFDLKDDEAIRKRYPGQYREDLKSELARISTREFKHEFWLQNYGASFKNNLQQENQIQVLLPKTDITRTVSLKELQKILLIPSTAPAGPIAFYLNFHLPINPLALPSEYELLDNSRLRSPVINFAHDIGHFFNFATRPNIERLDAIRPDLVKIRETIISKKDPELLQTFYFLIYFLRFEATIPLPVTSDQLSQQLQYLADYVLIDYDDLTDIQQLSGMAFNLFRLSLGSPFAPARNEKVFNQKLAEIIALVSNHNLDKSTLSLSEKESERKKILKQKRKNIRQGDRRQQNEVD